MMNMKKICSFYVSDWHLAVMLLPYIKKEIEEQKTIVTFLEQNLEENIEILLSKLNFKKEISEKIKQIKWCNNLSLKHIEIEKQLEKISGRKTIIVSGSKEYIENINNNLEIYISNNKNAQIKILNCYEVSAFNQNIKEVLDKHDLILNTSGERQIEEIFDGYEKKKKVI